MSVSSPTFGPTSPAEPDAQERAAEQRWRTLEKVATPKLTPVTPKASEVRADLLAAGLGGAELHTPLPPSPNRRRYLYAHRNRRRVPLLSSSSIRADGWSCDHTGSAEQSPSASGDSGMHTPKSKGRSKLPADPFLFSPTAPKRRNRRICLSPISPEPLCEADLDIISSTGESYNGVDACQPTPTQSPCTDACQPTSAHSTRAHTSSGVAGFCVAVEKSSPTNVSACDPGLSSADASASSVEAAADVACKVAPEQISSDRRRQSSQTPLSQRETIDGADAASATRSNVALRIPVPDGFDFSMAICSYGFFCMMPNQWIPSAETKGHGTFRRPLRYGKEAERCCAVDITCSEEASLSVRVDGDLPRSEAEEHEIVEQIKRMCRLDQSAFRGHTIESFWHLHPEAKARRFGYLFRSPTVWEDMVKTITICNARWKQSCTMNRLLCNEVSSRKGSFPSPWDVCRYSSEELQKTCSLGYRAERLRRLADSIVNGSLDISIFDVSSADSLCEPEVLPVVKEPTEAQDMREQKRPKRRGKCTSSYAPNHVAILQKLRSIYGFGTFASENMMQLLGFFNVDAFDSETIRHMREKHGVNLKKPQEVWDVARKHFACYSPFQFLAYWFELWKGYEAKSGRESPYWTAENSFFVTN